MSHFSGWMPRRRWLQFSFRTLLALLTVVAVALAIHLGAARRQRAAVQRVRALGGTALYSFDYDPKRQGYFGPRFRPEVPLRERWLGTDLFQSVTVVYLRGTPVKDDDLSLLAALPDLEELYVGATDITDRGLPHFHGLHKLRTLDLECTQITNAGLVHLESLESLQDLELDYNHQITGQGMKSVGRLANLRRLSLSATRVDDEGLKSLTPLKGLASLDLQSTRVTGCGLVHLQRLPKLRDLYLRLAPLADDAVQSLYQLSQVKRIRVGSNLSAAAIEELQAHLPGTSVDDQP